MRFVALPKFPGSRTAGYAAQKNFLRTTFFDGEIPNGYRRNFSLIGERFFSEYVEPSARWRDSIQNVISYPSEVMKERVYALGFERNPSPGEVDVVIVQIVSIEEWDKFVELYKPLSVGYIYITPNRYIAVNLSPRHKK